MFRALLCPSLVAHVYNVDYSSLPTPNFQPTANQERDDQCGNQHYSGELLMMGIVVPETCWAYKKYNKTISSIQLVLILLLSQRCTVQHTSNYSVCYCKLWLQKSWDSIESTFLLLWKLISEIHPCLLWWLLVLLYDNILRSKSDLLSISVLRSFRGHASKFMHAHACAC